MSTLQDYQNSGELLERTNSLETESISLIVCNAALTYFQNQLNQNGATVEESSQKMQQQIKCRILKSKISSPLTPTNGNEKYLEFYSMIEEFCMKIKEKESNFFDMLPDQLNLTRSNVERIFLGLSKSTFKNSISWGKIISFIVLTETFIIHFAKQHDVETIGVILECFKNFLESKLEPWISKEGLSVS